MLHSQDWLCWLEQVIQESAEDAVGPSLVPGLLCAHGCSKQIPGECCEVVPVRSPILQGGKLRHRGAKPGALCPQPALVDVKVSVRGDFRVE